MKLKPTLIGIVPCLVLALSGYAQVTTLDWTFSTAANPIAPDGPATSNPSGAAASATISPSDPLHATYYPGPYLGDPSLAGTRSGLWELVGATMEFKLDRAAVSTVNYTLVINQFYDNNGLLSGALIFGGPNTAPTQTGHTALTGAGDSGLLGQWYQDTYTWNGVSGAITLDMTPAPGASPNGDMILDQATFTITGALTAVPEPSTIAVLAAGLLTFLAGSRYVRKNKA